MDHDGRWDALDPRWQDHYDEIDAWSRGPELTPTERYAQMFPDDPHPTIGVGRFWRREVDDV